MENEKNKTTEEQKKSQAEPTDDVQLDIETVVPSVHEEEVTGSSTEKAEEESDDDHKSESTNESESKTEKKEDSDDERDEVETITPSA